MNRRLFKLCKRKLLFICFIFVLILPEHLFSQSPGDTLWTKTYGTSGNDGGSYIEKTHDDCFVVTGNWDPLVSGVSDIVLIKINQDGDTIWTKTYGGVNDDQGLCVRRTADDGFIIAGYTQSFGAGSYDIYLIKTDANGDTVWTSTYGTPDEEKANSVIQTSDGGYVVVGSISTGMNAVDGYYVRTDSNGHLEWAKTISGPLVEELYAVRQTSDGKYTMVGQYEHTPMSADFWLIKTDTAGDTLWTRFYGGPYREVPFDLQLTEDGGYIMSGLTSVDDDVSVNDIYVVRTEADGDTLWTRTYGTVYDDNSFRILPTSDGGYLICGVWGTFFPVPNFSAQIIKTDSDGNEIWVTNFDLSPFDMPMCAQESPDGGYYVCGITGNMMAGDVLLAKLYDKIPGYEYLPGDVNMYNGVWPPAPVVGADATYLINFFRGFTTSHSCFINNPDAPVLWPNGQPGQYFWASADVNGDCQVIGADVTKLINYLRGSGTLSWCVEYEPVWHNAGELPAEAPAGWPNCE
jgi:hypothetical protein